MEVVNENSLGDLKLKAHSATEETATSESVKCNGDVHAEEEMECADASPCNGDSKSIPQVDEPMDCSENGLELAACDQETDSLPEQPKPQDNHISAGEEEEIEDALIEDESRGEAEEDSLPDNCGDSRTDSAAADGDQPQESTFESEEQPEPEAVEEDGDAEPALASEDISSVNRLHSENLEESSPPPPQDDEDVDGCTEEKDEKEEECDTVDLSTPVKDQDQGEDDDADDPRNETTPEKNSSNKKKKTQPITNVTPRRSSRNINKTKSYVDETDVKSEDDDIQEVAEPKPVTTIQPAIVKKNTIVVSDTKRLAEIAAGSKAAAAKGGKKEPTLVIIDTNSLLANKSGQVSLTPAIPSRVSVVPVSAAQNLFAAKPVKVPPAVSITPPAAIVAKQQQQQLASARREIQSIPQQVLPSREPQVILPSLTDDMFVVEAPSFIVPYVYEKPPVNALKDFLKDLEKRVKEEQAERRKKEEQEEKLREEEERKRKEILAAQQPSPTPTQKDKEEIKMEVDQGEVEEKKDEEKKDEEKKDEEKKDEEKKDEEKKDEEKKDVEMKDVENKEDKKKDEEIKKDDEKVEKDEEKKEEEKMEVDVKEVKKEVKVKEEAVTKEEEAAGSDKAKARVEDKDKGKDEVKDKVEDKKVTGDIKEKVVRKEEAPTGTAATTDEKKTQPSDVEVLEDKTNKTKSDNYFENPLGKFFMQIGINLVQEHVQTDLLKNQMRKKDKEGNKCSADVHMAISALTKTLEVSKENNKPFRFDLNKCQLCNFRTESQLVMAHHLETPHMKNFVYRCNFCELEVRSPHDILFHMEAEHNVRGRLDRSPAFHQCPNCPFEDNQKGKLSRHLLSCAKKYKPERNQEPPLGWEPPAKIPRVRGARGLPLYPSPNAASLSSAARLAAVPGVVSPLSRLTASQAALAAQRGRGRPPMYVQRYPTTSPTGQKLAPHIRQGGVVFRPNSQGPVLLPTTPYSLTPSLIQVKQAKAVSNGATAKILQQPSISITPLPRSSATSSAPVGGSSSPGAGAASAQPKPGRPPTTATPTKNSFVICEICDGYIKDLEQLRNHMQWIHKVKIHPKMIYNRPPLNCQKCQFRFFTDQGLERHLLGSHGLVTSSMQEAANKGKDGGRCPVCGRVYQWKLLNHVARDHSMSLKPAHLSYKCTVCTATFGMYKQFENHVYSAHSVVAKRVIDKPKAAAAPPLPSHQPSTSANTGEAILKPLKINDEITIIPQPARVKQGVKPSGGATVTPTPVASKQPASK